jgi:hypothetical protein
MKSLKYIFMFVFFIFWISACSTPAKDLEISVKSTLTAIVKQTQAVATIPSVTPTLTQTTTSTPTPTPTLPPSPTPDNRIIDTDPSKLLCEKSDLPIEGRYKIPNQTWMSINTNAEVIAARGTTEGRDYVFRTQRVTGWWVDFYRNTKAAQLPKDFGCGVFMFRTPKGAQLALTKYNSVETNTSTATETWEYVENDFDLGDQDTSYVYYRLKKGGNREILLTIQFAYRNLMVDVSGFSDVESDVKIEDLLKVANIMMDRLKETSLVSPKDAKWPVR